MVLKKRNQIHVTSDGNPFSKKTWSATPYNICQELEKQNNLGKTFSFNLHPLLRKILTFLSILYYKQRKELNRGKLIRYSRAYFVFKQFKIKNKTEFILHMSNMGLPFYKKPKNQKHFVLIDSSWDLWLNTSENNIFFKKKYKKDVTQLEYKIFDQVEHIFTISEYLRNHLINHYKIKESKITAVGSGTGIIEPYFGEKDYSKKQILFVAKNRFEDKGGNLLIEAFQKVIEKDSSITLNIIGREENIEKYKDYKNINVYGYIPLDLLQNLFNESSLYVMPAKNEPWGLVYLEAMLCKTPVLGFNENAFPEICQNGKHGFILNSLNANSLAELILDAFSDLNRLKVKGQDAQNFTLQNFTWKKTATKIINEIKRHYE